ncbi:hypothetical protein C4D60_Mb11t08210 [Musa balbisiana]|uniref:Uncharacterized protein n=1 Tax=Musa balbisiana TaxID=52838 RepID=A0A4S8J523_MUSBA|nr:hypothetical protein C4D60_Mb11t08210 [Musa balbisiana]
MASSEDQIHSPTWLEEVPFAWKDLELCLTAKFYCRREEMSRNHGKNPELDLKLSLSGKQTLAREGPSTSTEGGGGRRRGRGLIDVGGGACRVSQVQEHGAGRLPRGNTRKI